VTFTMPWKKKKRPACAAAFCQSTASDTHCGVLIRRHYLRDSVYRKSGQLIESGTAYERQHQSCISFIFSFGLQPV
jgi:hypothetical protein